MSIVGLESLEGKRLPILTYPNPILKKKAIPVENFDRELVHVCQDMIYTMYHSQGVGLAAPQVGVGRRIFVTDVDYEREKIMDPETRHKTIRCKQLNPSIFINPVIVEKSGEIVFREGCLSLPGLYQEVTRFEKIVVNYQDLDGNVKVWKSEGLMSVCIQHENDHLDGIVFSRAVKQPQKRFSFEKILQKKVYLGAVKKLNTIFCGTPEFAIPTFKALEENKNVVLKSIVSMPDRPAGRGQRMTTPPVALFAREKGVALIQTDNINHSGEVKSLLENGQIDAVIVFGHLPNFWEILFSGHPGWEPSIYIPVYCLAIVVRPPFNMPFGTGIPPPGYPFKKWSKKWMPEILFILMR